MNRNNLPLARHAANEYGGWVKIVKWLSQAKPSQAKPSQAKPSQAKARQGKARHLKKCACASLCETFGDVFPSRN